MWRGTLEGSGRGWAGTLLTGRLAGLPAGMGRRCLPDLLLAGLCVGRAHHHGFLQQVPQQLLPVRSWGQP